MYEINLVPDVKREMLKTQKTRSLVVAICILVSVIAGGVVLLLLGVKGTQDLAMHNQDSKLEKMSNKLMSFKSLDEFVTIQNQLNTMKRISEEKTALSRVFNMLNVILDQGEDSVKISALNISTEDGDAVLSFEGQVDAKKAPFIDYRVLESFKKGADLTKYDYGRYVDAKGREIPTWCIKQSDAKGNNFVDEKGKSFAYWFKDKPGCNPSSKTKADTNDDAENKTTQSNTNEGEGEVIYRTPLFDEWYEKDSKDSKISLDGKISGVAHFESECISYSGKEGDGKVKWSSENSCKLSDDGISIRESSNGRDSSGALVLRFNAVLTVNPDVFLFKNKHMVISGPLGQNVTDSYVQVEGMFAERASDCGKDDAACRNAQSKTGEKR